MTTFPRTMQALPHLMRPTIPVAYLQLLQEILAERGIAPESLLAGLPAPPRASDHPESRLSAWLWSQLVMRALELTGDAALGYAYGLRMRPTAHGVVGYATMTATTLRQAMEISVRYARVRQSHFALDIEFDRDAGSGEAGNGSVDGNDGHCLVVLREKYPVPVLREFFVENILLALARGYAVLLGREVAGVSGIEVWFDWPQPAYHAAWADRLPPVRFAMPHNAIRLSSACLAQRPVLADPHASRQAIALCERELSLVPEDDADVTARVRAMLVSGPAGGYPRLAEIAGGLAVSERTLKRRLQQEGTSFTLMLEDARRRDAHELLSRTQLPVQQVAARLGYLNPANFTRAFNAWTGESPTSWRRQHLTRHEQ